MTEKPEEPRATQEIHAIRSQIQEETKGLTPEEVTAFYANAVREAEKMYGITFRRAVGKPVHKAI